MRNFVWLLLFFTNFMISSYPTERINYTNPRSTENVVDLSGTGKVLGSIAGTLNISGGNANYLVPINSFPGSNGMAPNLNLVYSSNNKVNSILGEGWSLSDLSAITRRALNEFDDGYNREINFIKDDSYSLDGNNLIPVEFNTQGIPTKYTTAVGNTTEVESFGDGSSYFNYFKVKTKDGFEIEYGNTQDSKVRFSNSNYIKWLKTKITDTKTGNYIEYVYDSHDNENWLSEIKYTGNGTNPTYAKVSFIYAKKSDNNTTYSNGINTNNNSIVSAKFNNTLLIDKIVCSITLDGETTYKVYDIKYSNLGKSYLTEIVEYGYTNDLDNLGQSLTSTVFEYGANKGLEMSSIPVADHGLNTVYSDFANLGEETYYFGNFDGDGVPDRLVVERDYDGGSGNQARWFLQFGKAYNSNDTKLTYENRSGNIFQFSTSDQHDGYQHMLREQVQVADLNSDGLDDLIIPFYSNGTDDKYSDLDRETEEYTELHFLVFLNKNGSFSYNSDYYKFYKVYKKQFNNYRDMICKEKLYVGDLDGDGYQEVMIKAKWVGHESPGTDGIRQVKDSWGNIYYFDLVDNNGELLDNSKNNQQYINGNYSEFMTLVEGYDDSDFEIYPIKADHDKTLDFLVITHDDNYNGIYNFNHHSGAHQKYPIKGITDLDDKRPIHMGDFNGDSFTDIFYLDTDENKFYMRIWNGSSLNSKIHFTELDQQRLEHIESPFYGHNVTVAPNDKLPPDEFDLENLNIIVADYDGDKRDDILAFRPRAKLKHSLLKTSYYTPADCPVNVHNPKNYCPIWGDLYHPIDPGQNGRNRTYWRNYPFVLIDHYADVLVEPYSQCESENRKICTTTVENGYLTYQLYSNIYIHDNVYSCDYSIKNIKEGSNKYLTNQTISAASRKGYGGDTYSWSLFTNTSKKNSFIGNGQSQIYNFSAPKHAIITIAKANFGRLDNVVDGYNNKIEIKYQQLANNNLQTEPSFHYIDREDIFANQNEFSSDERENYKEFLGSFHVVSKIKEYKSTDYENCIKETRFTYSGGVLNNKGKGFLGFKTINRYVSVPKFGWLHQTSKYLIDKDYGRLDLDIIKNNRIPDIDVLTESFNLGERKYSYYDRSWPDKYFKKVNSITKKNIETGIQSIVNTTYDDWENMLTNETQIGVVESGQFIKKKVTKITNSEFIKNGSWCLSVPEKVKIEKGHFNDDLNNLTPRYTQYIYDNNLLKVKIDDFDKTDKPELIKKNEFFYDSYGNLEKTIITSPDPNTNYNIKLEVNYDNLGRFEKEVIDIHGRQHQYFFNPDGSINHSIDIYGQTENCYYDSFGNLIKQDNSNGDVSEYFFEWADPNNNEITIDNQLINYLYKMTTKDYNKNHVIDQNNINEQTEVITTENFYGYDKKLLRTISEAFSNDYSLNRKFIYTDKVYNKFGKIIKESFPYYESSSNLKWVSYSSEFDQNGNVVNIKKIDNVESKSIVDGRITYSYDEFLRESKKEINGAGDLWKVTDPAGNVVEYKYNNSQITEVKTVLFDSDQGFVSRIKYDVLGRKNVIFDPDNNFVDYGYDGLDNLVYHKNSNGIKLITRDELGRSKHVEYWDNDSTKILHEIEYDFVDQNDNDQNGFGKIDKVIGPNYSQFQDYKYDSKDRVIEFTEQIDFRRFTKNYDYDQLSGRVSSETYPDGHQIDFIYDSKGFAIKHILKRDNKPDLDIWQLSELDENGKVIEYMRNDGKLVTNFSYDKSGHINNILHRHESNTTQNYSYEYNAARGVMNQRLESNVNFKEDFDYKNSDPSHDDYLLNRLTEYNVVNQNTNESVRTDMEYSNDGSIRSKGREGEYLSRYEYIDPLITPQESNKPHAPKNIIGMREDIFPSVITYTPFNKVKSITNCEVEGLFLYGVDNQRRKYIEKENNRTHYSKYYFGNYELTYNHWTNKTKKVTYLRGCVIVNDGVDEKIYFINKDNLGSITQILRESGTIKADFNYDPWGRRRDASNWLKNIKEYNSDSNFDILGRGFTGHEHMTRFGLINMNGRVYDPILGMFTMADPTVQFTDNSQNYNKYIYALNNPLLYTDHSGYIIDSIIYFIYGYVKHGVETGNWGWEAVINGGLTLLTKNLEDAFNQNYNADEIASQEAEIERMQSGKTVNYNKWFKAGIRPVGNIGNSGVNIGAMLSMNVHTNWGWNIQTDLGLDITALINVMDLQGGDFGGIETRIGAGLDIFNPQFDFFNYLENHQFKLGVGVYNTYYINRETNQTVGGLKAMIGSFYARYENDGAPFPWLKDNHSDRLRTAASQFGFRDKKLGINMFSGDPASFVGQDSDDWSKGGGLGSNLEGKFGEIYPNGYYTGERNQNYRLGALYFGSGNMRRGINSEWVRHTFQNLVAHNLISPQPGLMMINDHIFKYYNFGSNYRYSLW